MRAFNKVFVIALPRCATVTMSDALGIMEVRTAHLGRIYGEASREHNHPERLGRMYEQISAGDFDLDVLKICDGLADYPVTCIEVVRQLDIQFPGSLFVNVRRDDSMDRWLQSVERQFVGLQLIKQGQAASAQEREFMQVMLAFRTMTFGVGKFDVDAYAEAYMGYQAAVDKYFAGRNGDLLSVGLTDLAEDGFGLLSKFLECQDMDLSGQAFPNCNEHSIRPQEAFMSALEAGDITSQTGIVVSRCS